MNEVSTKKRILVVDDAEIFLGLMEDLLKKEGFEVLLARNGLEALQTVKHEMPNLDLVLLDLLLPQMTGFDVLKEIRAGKLGKDLPVLVITGVFKRTAQIEQLKKLGATGYMTKNLKPNEIVYRIKSTLGMTDEETKGSISGCDVEEKKLDKLALLKKVEIFKGLTDEELSRIAGLAEEHEYPKDEMIFVEGDEGDALYIVVEGSVRVVKLGEREEVIAIIRPLNCFGEMSLMDRERRSASVIADDKVKLLLIHKEDFENLLDSDRELAFNCYRNFVKVLSQRLRDTDESLTFSRALLEAMSKKNE